MSADALVAEAVLALRAGRPVLVLDDEDREDEGDVVLAASAASPAWVAWTVRRTSGLLCAPMPPELADHLDLPDMVERNQDSLRTAYTVSVDAAAGVGTGISAADRARTARVLADPTSGPGDLVRPGHVLPLRARPGGVLERRGHTEAAVDLCRLAGLPPVGVIAELVTDDGDMLRGDAVRALGAEHDLPVLTITDLVDHLSARRAARGLAELPAPVSPSAPRVREVARAVLPSRWGDFTVVAFSDLGTGAPHLAVVAAPPAGGAAAGAGAPPLVRVHSECLTGDALGSLRCDCGPQLQASLRAVAEQGGVVVHLGGHEGRGIGILAKIAAYAAQDAGMDTVDANTALGLPVDAREYGGAAAVLRALGVASVRLLTNNPEKVAGLAAHGVEVVERVPLLVPEDPHRAAYLATKRERMGHALPDPAAGPQDGAAAGAAPAGAVTETARTAQTRRTA